MDEPLGEQLHSGASEGADGLCGAIPACQKIPASWRAAFCSIRSLGRLGERHSASSEIEDGSASAILVRQRLRTV